MSSRFPLKPFSVITNGNMASNITSLPTIVQNTSMVSYDISWIGTAPNGTISVQASNTYQENAAGGVAVAGNWTSLPLSSTPVINSNSGAGAVDIDATGFYALRLVYTANSGSGTMNAVIAGKNT